MDSESGHFLNPHETCSQMSDFDETWCTKKNKMVRWSFLRSRSSESFNFNEKLQTRAKHLQKRAKTRENVRNFAKQSKTARETCSETSDRDETLRG